MNEFIKSQSKLYKGLLVVTGLYFVLRIIAQQAIHLGLIDTGLDTDIAIWFGRDLRIVVGAALRLADGGKTYYLDVWPEGFDVYNYTPFYALLISQIATRLPFNVHAFLHGILTIVAYFLLFVSWRRIFSLIDAPKATRLLLVLLPLWLIYEGFWSDSLLLNVYIVLAITTSWLFVLVWQERLIPSALLLILILQIKPQWAFVLGLPLVLGRFSFFFKLLLLTILGYLGVMLTTILWLGWDYGLAQYRDYYTMLIIAPSKIRWHGPGEYIGYDHSIAQIYFYLFGYRPEAWSIVRLIKLALIIPFGITTVLFWLRYKKGQFIHVKANQAFEAFFALYFIAFIWLDLVWEITLSIVFFHYLWVTANSKLEKWLFALPFLIYAFADLWRVIGIPVSALIFGTEAVSTIGPPIWADPLFRIPIIMIVILTGYFLLIRRFIQDIVSPKKINWE